MGVKNKPKMPRTVLDSSEDETNRLIQAAARQPGVAELLSVYESWRRFDEVFEAHNQFMATKHVVSTSSSSGPVLRQVA